MCLEQLVNWINGNLFTRGDDDDDEDEDENDDDSSSHESGEGII
jgi:hypothetical protein